MKVVIDTNIWISFLIGKLLSNLVELILNKQVKVISSNEQIAEIFSVITKPKLKKYISNSDIKRLYHFITKYTKSVKINNDLNVCRDPKDNYLLEIAIKGKAEYLVTGDKDLLVLNPFHKVKILNYKEFEKLFQD